MSRQHRNSGSGRTTPDPLSSEVRVGDRDRESTANILGQALAEGYLDLPAYESRVQAAFTADTNGELRELVIDLPLARLRRRSTTRRPTRRRSARPHLAAYLMMVAVALAVWLTAGLSAGAWYFWPIWPILGVGFGIFRRAIPRCSPRST